MQYEFRPLTEEEADGVLEKFGEYIGSVVPNPGGGTVPKARTWLLSSL